MAERDIGGFIRDMRRNAKVSLRQLADQAGVSNPYLSQIERGLRKPSAEVLQQIANALKVSTPLMYLRAGLLNQKDGPSTLAAIASDPDLSARQKQTLTEIYQAFRRESAREAGEPTDAEGATSSASPFEDAENVDLDDLEELAEEDVLAPGADSETADVASEPERTTPSGTQQSPRSMRAAARAAKPSHD